MRGAEFDFPCIRVAQHEQSVMRRLNVLVPLYVFRHLVLLYLLGPWSIALHSIVLVCLDEEDLVVDVESTAEPACLDAPDADFVPPFVQALENLHL